jgi:hypothetical protein
MIGTGMISRLRRPARLHTGAPERVARRAGARVGTEG